jgi:hypothetical protein
MKEKTVTDTFAIILTEMKRKKGDYGSFASRIPIEALAAR